MKVSELNAVMPKRGPIKKRFVSYFKVYLEEILN
jgi:hypothetical protein